MRKIHISLESALPGVCLAIGAMAAVAVCKVSVPATPPVLTPIVSTASRALPVLNIHTVQTLNNYQGPALTFAEFNDARKAIRDATEFLKNHE